jgi:hypothetical protein
MIAPLWYREPRVTIGGVIQVEAWRRLDQPTRASFPGFLGFYTGTIDGRPVSIHRDRLHTEPRTHDAGGRDTMAPR